MFDIFTIPRISLENPKYSQFQSNSIQEVLAYDIDVHHLLENIHKKIHKFLFFRCFDKKLSNVTV